MTSNLVYWIGMFLLVGVISVWTIVKLKSSPKKSWVEQLEAQRHTNTKGFTSRLGN